MRPARSLNCSTHKQEMRRDARSTYSSSKHLEKSSLPQSGPLQCANMSSRHFQMPQCGDDQQKPSNALNVIDGGGSALGMLGGKHDGGYSRTVRKLRRSKQTFQKGLTTQSFPGKLGWRGWRQDAPSLTSRARSFRTDVHALARAKCRNRDVITDLPS